MRDMNSNASDRDKAVSHDSGWVEDGHTINWNGQHGAFLGHPPHCPFAVEHKIRVYYCSPGCHARDYGIDLTDLPQDDYHAIREAGSIGSEQIRWRVQEVLHPDLTPEEQDTFTTFRIELDTEDDSNE